MAKQEVAKQAAADAFAEPKAAPSRKRLLFFVIIPMILLLLAGGGAGYYFFFMAAPEEAKKEAPPPPKPSVFYNLPELLVNLNPAGRRTTSFLKMTVSLELESTADVARVQQVMPRIVDNMQSYLRELRTDDVIGTAGLSRMRQELINRVNAAAYPTKVNDVLFLEVLLQ